MTHLARQYCGLLPPPMLPPAQLGASAPALHTGTLVLPGYAYWNGRVALQLKMRDIGPSFVYKGQLLRQMNTAPACAGMHQVQACALVRGRIMAADLGGDQQPSSG